MFFFFFSIFFFKIHIICLMKCSRRVLEGFSDVECIFFEAFRSCFGGSSDV